MLPMPLPPLTGHAGARRRLADGRRAGNLPQVLLVSGPQGVGKQRLALWLGQLVLCERPGDEPCGRCRMCRMVEELAHPDLHWFFPIARPKAGEPGKQVEEAADALADEIAARRKQPMYALPDGMAIHPIASVRLLQQQAGLTAVEAGWRVFIIGDADRLVPQEASQEAANAMLKLLEEPPPRSLFVLTTVMSRPADDRAIVDAGLKASSVDSGMPLVWQRPGLVYRSASDEHGWVEIGADAVAPKLGEKLLLVPGHCDPTVNLYDWYVCTRNGLVEQIWPVSARGALA